MRKLKTTAIIDLKDSVGTWNTKEDRWSRRAKHQLSHNELVDVNDLPTYEIGDTVMYEGKATAVKIPDGPRGTIGIIVEGHLKMVHSSKVSKEIREGVMGGVMAMPAINRMMQLAGLEHTGAVSLEETEPQQLSEDAASMMIDNLAKQAENLGQYKGKPEAAKLYAIGSVLSALYKSVAGSQFQSTEAIAKKKELDALGVFGADLIKTSQMMSAAQSQATKQASSTATVPAAK